MEMVTIPKCCLTKLLGGKCQTPVVWLKEMPFRRWIKDLA